MDCSTPGLPVLYQLPEFAQAHVHQVSDAIQSSVIPLSSCLQSSPASGSVLMSRLLTSGSQSIGPSASASILPMNIQDWFPLGLTGLISLLSRDSQESSLRPQFKSINYLVLILLYGPTLTHHFFTVWYTTPGKTIALTIWTSVSKVMSLLSNTLSWFVIAFLPRGRLLLISWWQSPCSDFGAQENSLSLFPLIRWVENNKTKCLHHMGFPWWLSAKESACNAGASEDAGLIPGVREISWRREWLPTPVLAWTIPQTDEPGGPQSTGSIRIEHDWSNLARTPTWLRIYIPDVLRI